MRAVIYCRISSDRTGDGLGVERQLDDCRRRAEQRGWTVTAEHTDNDLSAAGGKRRPGFEAVLDAVASGNADAVVAWSLDRLTRNRRDTLRIVETCEPQQTVIALVRGSDLDLGTPSGRMTAGILAEVARHEIDVAADRQRRAYVQQAARGLPHFGGCRPFGFEADRVTHRPVEADALRWAYAHVGAGGSLVSVARRWNGEGLVSGKPGRGPVGSGPSSWSPQSVKRVLCAARNAGVRVHHGEVVGPGVWEPIVSEDVWRAVTARLTDPGRSSVTAARSLLGGLACCAVCGGSVEGNARRGDAGYRCAEGRHVHRRAAEVDDYVTRLVVERLSRGDAVELLDRRERADVGRVRSEATALRSRLESLAVDFADGDLTAGQLRTATERLRARIAGLEAEIADAGRVDVLGPLVGAADVQKAWDGLGRDARRAVVDVLMTVRLDRPGRGVRRFDPASVEIVWRGRE